jgi:hypothetical protein
LGCSGTQSETAESRPAISVSSNAEIQKQNWDKLSAKERLNKLVTKNYPIFTGFDHQRETTLATVQEYCNQIGDLSAEKIVSSIHYVNEDEFLNVFSKEAGGLFSQAEIKLRQKSTVGIHTKEGEIYFNQSFLDEIARNTANQPELITKLKKYDIETLYKMCNLAHEITHEIVKKEQISFSEFTIKPYPIKFNAINGFVIEGKDPSGRGAYIQGAQEAVVDCAARIIIEEKMGLSYLTTPEYANGSYLVNRLNKIASISNEDFLKYIKGELRQSQLFEKWGACNFNLLDKENTNLKKGVIILSDIGRATQGAPEINFQNVEQNINNNFKSSIK